MKHCNVAVLVCIGQSSIRQNRGRNAIPMTSAVFLERDAHSSQRVGRSVGAIPGARQGHSMIVLYAGATVWRSDATGALVSVSRNCALQTESL